MTYSLDLLFLDSPIFEGSGHRTQLARVHVKTSSGGAYRGVNPSLEYITPECVALGEFEAQIDRLQAELEAVRKKARRKFAASKRNSN